MGANAVRRQGDPVSERFRPMPVSARAGADGATILSVSEPLRAYPARMHDHFFRWAEAAPQRTFLAERRPGEDGWASITYGEAGEKAMEMIQALVEEPEIGREYDGKVRRLTAFGAFIEILPGTDGLLHISEIDVKRVEKVEDYFKVGDSVRVKVINIDPEGKIRLSRKALLVNR